MSEDELTKIADWFIEHKELFEAYPQLKNVEIELFPPSFSRRQDGAKYDPRNKKIKINELIFNEHYNRTKSGEYIIPIGADHGLYDVLVYVNDDPITPKISKIIKLVEEETGYIEEIWRNFLRGKITEVNVRTAISYVDEIVGEGYVKQYYAGNSTSFQSYNERKNRERAENSREVGRKNKRTFKRYDIGERTDTESNGISEGNFGGDISFSLEEQEFNKNTKADLKETAFSMPDEQYSLPEAEEVLNVFF